MNTPVYVAAPSYSHQLYHFRSRSTHVGHRSDFCLLGAFDYMAAVECLP